MFKSYGLKSHFLFLCLKLFETGLYHQISLELLKIIFLLLNCLVDSYINIIIRSTH